MNGTILIALSNNAALLLGLAIIYEITYLISPKHRRLKPIFSGLLIALICVAVMYMPFNLESGIFFDTRTIIISVTGLIFGPIPTVITVAAASVYRLFIGGPGVYMGLATIFTSALIGLAWRRWLYPKTKRQRFLSIYAMSMIVHIVMLTCALLLPYPSSISIIKDISLSVIGIFPFASVLLSLLLFRQQEIRQTQEELKQSEEKYRKITDNVSDVVWSTDLNLKQTFVSPSVERLMGESVEAHMNRTLEERFPPDSINKIHEILKEEFEKEKDPGCNKSRSRIVELAHYRADGTIVWLSMNISFIRDENGNPVGFLGASRDITELKKAEEELRVSEDKHRLLYETMALGVIYQGADGAILSANPAAERILGMTFEQMQNKTSMNPEWKSIREDGSEVPGSEHPIMIALRTGKPFGPFIMGVYNPQKNDHVWLSINAIPLFLPGEAAPYQAYSTFQDITAELKAHQDYELLFREMVDAFALHEIICDDDGKPVDYRFLAANPAFESMTGLKSADILGKTVLEVLPKTEPYWIEKFGRVALTGEPIVFNNYSASLGKYYAAKAYRPSKNQFVVTFTDITEQTLAEEKVMESLSRLKGLLDNSPGPIVIFDEDGRFVEVSASAEKIIGLPKAELYMKEVCRIAPPDIAKNVSSILSHREIEGKLIKTTDVFDVKGKKRYFESRTFPIHAPSNRKKLFGYIGINVTDRIMAEQALIESETKYASYIENAPYGVCIVNEKGQFLEVNRCTSRITGYGRDQLLRMSIQEITAEESLESAIFYFEKMIREGFVSSEFKFIHKNGSTRWWSIVAVKLSDSRFLGFCSDITEKKDTEANILYLLNHDVLTGLYNRGFYDEELKRLDAENQLPLSIIIGDINGLKLINDSFGHSDGDKIIAEAARLIRGCCREGDILARTGGDEFTILMPKTDKQTAIELLGAIQAACKQYNSSTPNEAFHVNLALGADSKERVEEDFLQVSKRAANYMHQRKLLEKNSLQSGIISSIKATMFEKSNETEEHAERISLLSRKVGMILNLSQVELDHLELLGTLHDIGKVGIPEHILNKPGRLDEDEWVEMKKHPEIGYRIAMSSPNLAPIAEGILCHHERWDGKGYPQNLSGTDIPLLARILTVVDSYDAMTEDRVYRKAMPHEAAIEEIKKNSGTQFDPQIASIFTEAIPVKELLQEMNA